MIGFQLVVDSRVFFLAGLTPSISAFPVESQVFWYASTFLLVDRLDFTCGVQGDRGGSSAETSS